MYETRVLSGMRPTGALHLGHYHGVLKNWVRLQAEHPCLFFIADWHALTTDYEKPGQLEKVGLDMVIDWLASGIDPNQATLFIQSHVPEHAELHLLLSMMAPLGWLERVPTYKDQQEKLTDRDLATYGFLGYPLLQSADILIYRAKYVPVGEDQVPHIEFAREVARRFNHLYGREPGFEEKTKAAVKKLGSKKARLLNDLRTNKNLVIELSPEQTEQHFCANVLQLATSEGKRIIVMSRRAYEGYTEQQRTQLAEHGQLLALNIDTIEDVGGGSVRCMLAEIF